MIIKRKKVAIIITGSMLLCLTICMIFLIFLYNQVNVNVVRKIDFEKTELIEEKFNIKIENEVELKEIAYSTLKEHNLYIKVSLPKENINEFVENSGYIEVDIPYYKVERKNIPWWDVTEKNIIKTLVGDPSLITAVVCESEKTLNVFMWYKQLILTEDEKKILKSK